MEVALPELPHEVIVDILSRLPCKTLLKFRCVAKHWNSFIRSNTFTHLHLTRSNQLRVLLRPKPFYSIRYSDLDDFVEKGFDVVVKDHTPPLLAHHLNNSGTRFVGVCNGLVCFLVNEINEGFYLSFLLWNPTMRECAEVDTSRVDVVNSEKILCDSYGFGYDSTTRDYKIVKMVVYERTLDVLDVEILNLASGTSRKLELPTFSFNTSAQGEGLFFSWNCSFLNGVCYWLIRKSLDGDDFILSVDMEKEEVNIATIFPPSLRRSLIIRELAVCGGKLVLANTDILTGNNKMEIWMIDEYGMGSASFSKKMTVNKVPMLKFRTHARPLCYSRKGGILIYDGKRFAMYDSDTKTCKVVRGTSWGREYITMYAETLISPYHISNTAGIGNLGAV